MAVVRFRAHTPVAASWWERISVSPYVTMCQTARACGDLWYLAVCHHC